MYIDKHALLIPPLSNSPSIYIDYLNNSNNIIKPDRRCPSISSILGIIDFIKVSTQDLK